MGLFNDRKHAVPAGREALELAVQRFGMARGHLLAAVLLTVVNLVLLLAGTDTYFLFSISFSYYLFGTETLLDLLIPLLVLGFYLCCFLFSRTKPGFLIAALAAFCLDCLFLFCFSLLLVGNTGVSFSDFLMDYLTHLWVLVFLILGVCSIRRYREALHSLLRADS